MTMIELAQLAPIGTASIALVAALIALRAMYAQRDVARKRAALDIFLKTEMDSHLQQSWDEFDEALSILDGGVLAQAFCTEAQHKGHFKAVRRYLAIHEVIAVGLKNKMLDEQICFDYFASVLLRSYESTKEVIKFVQKQPHEELYFVEMSVLARKWARREKETIERLARSPG